MAKWLKAFGGSMDDWGTCVRQTSDGGYVVSGTTRSGTASGSDVYLLKVDAQGQQSWARNFGPTLWEHGMQVQQTKDGGYIVVGRGYNTVSQRYEMLLLKTDADGNESWAKNLVWRSDADAMGQSVQQTTDGGYIVAGWTWGQAYLVKTDSMGNTEWWRDFGGSRIESAYSVQQTSDGGYILAGETESYGAGTSDMYLVQTDAQGNEEWHKTFGGTSVEIAFSVQQTTDGGYIVAGQTSSFGAYKEGYLVKTDANGNQEWSKVFGGQGDDFLYCVQQTGDGGYILVGWTQSFGRGEEDVYLVKTDAGGNRMWYRTFGEYKFDSGWWVQQTSDGGYIITGGTRSYGTGSSDVILIKTDAEGRT
ncbi:MAG: hypothetical protein AB1603_07585 [Chloroflexota bacterium]